MKTMDWNELKNYVETAEGDLIVHIELESKEDLSEEETEYGE